MKMPIVDRGRLGLQSGRGFYAYPNPAYRQADFSTGQAVNRV